MSLKSDEEGGSRKNVKGSTSIVVRLTVLSVIKSTLILLLATGSLYLVLVKVLEIQDKNVLIDRIGIFQVMLHEKSMKEIKENLEWQDKYFQPGVFYIRVMNESGEVLLQSPGMEEILPVSLGVPPLASPSHARRGAEKGLAQRRVIFRYGVVA